jgi:hypothetical protein
MTNKLQPNVHIHSFLLQQEVVESILETDLIHKAVMTYCTSNDVVPQHLNVILEPSDNGVSIKVTQSKVVPNLSVVKPIEVLR